VKVVIINESMASRFWPNQDAVGKRLKWGAPQSQHPWLTIAGIIGDLRQSGPDQPVEPAIYMPLRQMEPDVTSVLGRSMRLVVRTRTEPPALIGSLRKEIAALDPELPLFEVRAMNDVIRAAVAPRRFSMLLVGLFAGLALILACVGIYGVMAFTVRQRTQEIGIRMALGAGRGEVLRMTLWQGMRLVVMGMVIGTVSALVLTRVMTTLLYQTKPNDPVVFVIVPVTLAVVALVACWMPARRAAKIDPLLALRHE
jgi:predicted permease